MPERFQARYFAGKALLSQSPAYFSKLAIKVANELSDHMDSRRSCEGAQKITFRTLLEDVVTCLLSITPDGKSCSNAFHYVRVNMPERLAGKKMFGDSFEIFERKLHFL